MEAQGVKHIGHLDIAGGGQVVVQGDYAFVGHLRPPHGTSVVDVADPRRPRIVAELQLPLHTHSHKVRVCRDLMAINSECFQDNKAFPGGGLKLYDISRPTAPREIAFFRTEGRGVHRFDMDERYAYISTEAEGYIGAITMIVDLRDPARPQEVSRWWLPGQWRAGGEQPTWSGREHRTHHPLRLGDRLYVSCSMGGMAIVDISDLQRPTTLGRLSWTPPYQNPVHTVLPVPFSIRGRRWAVVVEEDVTEDVWEDPPACVWMIDVTDERHPVSVATFQVPEDGFPQKGKRFGAHQPREKVDDQHIYVTWFSAGLRIVDISNPYQPREVGYFIPDPVGGHPMAQTNDVSMDGRGLLYVIDRHNGLDIIEFAGR